MTRIAPATAPSPAAQEQLDAVQKKLGGTPNIFTTMAHSPAAFGFYLAGSEALNGGDLPALLREQIALTVAGLNGCDYCASAHTLIGKGAGGEDSDLRAALKGSSADPRADAALKFATALTVNRGQVSDEELQAVRNAGYSDGEVLEIIAVVALNIFTNYFNEVAGTEIDFPPVRAKVSEAA
ncbi:MAG: carboxymuconolactone decarboxylase family protein [Alphaproteobacteria bacterium]